MKRNQTMRFWHSAAQLLFGFIYALLRERLPGLTIQDAAVA